ncbi:MAG: von Willebrand factor type A domain-containing protein, partial [Planctomycetota bacterium]|nr:von Willebrand factor type A domain-containing protein [Planctomycetota bacterium]
MTNPVFNPEDPRLTAFVLGEIDDSDRAEIEQLLETSEEAQAAVKEIEETIGALKVGLASEPTPELTDAQRAAVEQQLAGPTVASTVEASPQRSGAWPGKIAGFVASVSALGLIVTLALPALQQAREASISLTSKDAAATSAPELVAMNDSSEAEESFSMGDFSEPSDDRISATAQLKPNDEFEKSAGSLGISADASRQYPRPANELARVKSQVETLRAESETEPNRSQVAKTEIAEKPADSAFRANEARRTASSQRLIADSGSRPSGKDGPMKSGDVPEGRSLSISGRSAPGNSDSKNDPFSTSPNELTQASRTPLPVAGEPAAGSSGLPQQLAGAAGAAGGKSVNAPGVEGPRPVTVQTDKSKGRLNGSAIGGAVAGSPEPGQPVASLPGQGQQKKKNVLFFEEASPSSLPKFAVKTGPASEAEALKQIRGREDALTRAGESKKEELADEHLAKQSATRLAAIDAGATPRFSGRGLGLKGRNLQEQLREYSDNLSLARTSLERMPEARQSGGFGNETYEAIVENDFIVPVIGDKEKSLSTISVDVDTASYANMRRFLNRDQLPPANSVRIEELVNYFNYNYPEPEGNEPFSVKTELATCPWQPSHRLAMVGLKAKTIDKAKRPPTNLVFLLDVSGSMRASNKLPLVQQSMRLLVEEMTEDDRVSIVAYASNAGVRLESTLGSKKQDILNAINSLQAGGSTNGEGGIRMAYDEANRHYFQGGANRVILCSDGDFNVGKSSDGDLVELIQEKAASGVFLSVFGFGMGNLKDGKLEKLADKGNGHYGYIDNLNEAKKVFQDELVGTLYTVAKDVKLQVEFNPATVGAYRLIGYENRKLAAQDFTDDTKDAGEIGSGHTVTALYEIIPKHVLLEQPSVDGLKYQASEKNPAGEDAKEAVADSPAVETAEPSKASQELLTVKLRYKKPDEEVSEAVANDYPVTDVEIAGKQLSPVSDDLMFAASVASFGMNLRGSKYRGNWGFAEALESAQGAQGDGNDAQRTEFIQLVQRAMRITGQQVGLQPRTDEGTTTRPGELGATEARIKASVDGKYRRLVKKIEVRDDFQRFGAFNDYGRWDGTEYAGHKDLPPGNWVYVYPNWYIWAEVAVPATVPATVPA